MQSPTMHFSITSPNGNLLMNKNKGKGQADNILTNENVWNTTTSEGEEQKVSQVPPTLLTSKGNPVDNIFPIEYVDRNKQGVIKEET